MMNDNNEKKLDYDFFIGKGLTDYSDGDIMVLDNINASSMEGTVKVDMVLIMTVQPGFGGQKYLPECTEKIVELKELIDREELDVDIQVDGGINDETMETVMKAGANLLVAGSYVFSGDLETNVYSIQKKMDKIKSEID